MVLEASKPDKYTILTIRGHTVADYFHCIRSGSPYRLSHGLQPDPDTLIGKRPMYSSTVFGLLFNGSAYGSQVLPERVARILGPLLQILVEL
jgi:hypothetical protein